MSKILITSGCSFSECVSTHIDTWPRHLIKSLYQPDPNPEFLWSHLSLAMGSQGNGLISRGVIYHVNELLQTHSPEKLLVGIMWSGNDRNDFYQQHPIMNGNDGAIENPTGFIPNRSKNWIIVNHNWKNQYAKAWYSELHDRTGSVITSFEHILRTQWFLEKHNIAYFMTTYTGEVFDKHSLHHPEVEYLYNLIDKSKFLPIVGEFEWCRDHSKHEFPIPGDPHPGTEQHRDFVEQVVMPWLLTNNLIGP